MKRKILSSTLIIKEFDKDSKLKIIMSIYFFYTFYKIILIYYKGWNKLFLNYVPLIFISLLWLLILIKKISKLKYSYKNILIIAPLFVISHYLIYYYSLYPHTMFLDRSEWNYLFKNNENYTIEDYFIVSSSIKTLSDLEKYAKTKICWNETYIQKTIKLCTTEYEAYRGRYLQHPPGYVILIQKMSQLLHISYFTSEELIFIIANIVYVITLYYLTSKIKVKDVHKWKIFIVLLYSSAYLWYLYSTYNTRVDSASFIFSALALISLITSTNYKNLKIIISSAFTIISLLIKYTAIFVYIYIILIIFIFNKNKLEKIKNVGMYNIPIITTFIYLYLKYRYNIVSKLIIVNKYITQKYLYEKYILKKNYVLAIIQRFKSLGKIVHYPLPTILFIKKLDKKYALIYLSILLFIFINWIATGRSFFYISLFFVFPLIYASNEKNINAYYLENLYPLIIALNIYVTIIRALSYMN